MRFSTVSVSEVWAARETLLSGLTPAEREVFDQLAVDKRRHEWFAGRIAAKRAVQRELGLPFPRLEIRLEESGRPLLFVDERPSALHLSITHSGGIAAAIAASHPIGLDVERIEPRDHTFEALVLTDGDRSRLDGLTGPARDESLTLLWCEKEAYAKLEGSGLRIPFADLVVPAHVAVERGTLAVGGVPFAFAIVIASAEWLTTPAPAAKDP